MANLNVMRCPSCGAALDVSSEDTRVTCAYCGTSLTIGGDQAGRGRPDGEGAGTDPAGGKVDATRLDWVEQAAAPEEPTYRPPRPGAGRAGILRAHRRRSRILFLLLLAGGLAVAGCILLLFLGVLGGSAGAGAGLTGIVP
jgi:hypothetical protein